MRCIFDKSDLVGDEEKHEHLHVYNNEELMAEYPALSYLKEEIS